VSRFAPPTLVYREENQEPKLENPQVRNAPLECVSFEKTSDPQLEHLLRRDLLLGTSTVPIDDACQLTGILAELELKLTLFVDDQLGSRVKNTGALVLVRIV
jgi:hypothetical protein